MEGDVQEQAGYLAEAYATSDYMGLAEDLYQISDIALWSGIVLLLVSVTARYLAKYFEKKHLKG